MLYEVISGEVLTVEEVTTSNQTAVIKKHFGMERKIIIFSPKTALALNEPLIITFQWQKFNSETEVYQSDISAEEMTFQVTGQSADTLQPIDGVDTLTFSSAEPGTYTIKTLNPGVSNDSLEVVVSA
jgi:hypothetical protein